jgi:hypothetical protein
MKLLKDRNVLYVKDKDEISIIVELEPSVYDPLLSKAGVSKTYRVIGNSYGPTFELVSLTKEPVVLSDIASGE